MIRFYDAAIETEPRGSAVLFREPRLLGHVLFSIADIVHGDRRRLYACDANDDEHGKNLKLAQVSEVDEQAAVKLATEYMPERLMPRTDPMTEAAENQRLPACDLRLLLAGGETGAIGGDLLREDVI